VAELRGVTVGEALRDVSLTLHAGEQVALLGGNGAGKTTLGLTLKGLLAPSSGQALLAGEEMTGQSPAVLASRAALLFQDPRSQIFCATLREEVAFGPSQLGWPAERVEAAVGRARALAEVTAELTQPPLELAAGELRWVALASVLALEAPLVLLDEPSAGLDGPGRERLERVLARLRQAGTTVVLITHDLELAADHCERAIVMEEGRVWADGPFAEVFGGTEPPPALRFPVAARVARALGLPGKVCSTEALLGKLGRQPPSGERPP
jgi:energy-coupling factor transport system ATP-binding protein